MRAQLRGQIKKGRRKINDAEQTGRAKIRRRATRSKDELDAFVPSATVDVARYRIDEWEKSQNEKLTRKLAKARRDLGLAENSGEWKLGHGE